MAGSRGSPCAPKAARGKSGVGDGQLSGPDLERQAPANSGHPTMEESLLNAEIQSKTSRSSHLRRIALLTIGYTVLCLLS